jgi:uncharacterized protein YjbJ (UPF0337 family)
MDEDRTKGASRKAKGSVKEAIGKITGNKSTEADGAAQKAGRSIRPGFRQDQGFGPW